MKLLLTTTDPQNNLRKFSCTIGKLDGCFNLLNQIVNKGDNLVFAQLVDEHGTIVLPVEAFNGVSMSEQIRELEGEWKSILAQPRSTDTKENVVSSSFTNRLLAVCEEKIVRSSQWLSSIESLLLQSQEISLSPARKQILENSHQRAIRLFQRQLRMAYHSRQRLLQRIDK